MIKKKWNLKQKKGPKKFKKWLYYPLSFLLSLQLSLGSVNARTINKEKTGSSQAVTKVDFSKTKFSQLNRKPISHLDGKIGKSPIRLLLILFSELFKSKHPIVDVLDLEKIEVKISSISEFLKLGENFDSVSLKDDREFKFPDFNQINVSDSPEDEFVTIPSLVSILLILMIQQVVVLSQEPGVSKRTLSEKVRKLKSLISENRVLIMSCLTIFGGSLFYFRNQEVVNSFLERIFMGSSNDWRKGLPPTKPPFEPVFEIAWEIKKKIILGMRPIHDKMFEKYFLAGQRRAEFYAQLAAKKAMQKTTEEVVLKTIPNITQTGTFNP